jgi:phage major head subunit gpT-like protein
MTPSNYAAFITTVDTSVGALYTEMDASVQWQKYTKLDPMTGGSIKSYGWIGMTPKPQPWFGTRKGYEPAPLTQQVEVIPYELTAIMDAFVLDDSDPNAMSIFWQMLPMMARQWRRHPEYELRDLLEARGMYAPGVGQFNRQLGRDGATMFGLHSINPFLPGYNNGSNLFGGGTYQTDFTGGYTPPYSGAPVVGGPFGVVSFTTIRAYMRSIPLEDGETAGVIPDTVIIPTTLEAEADMVLKATTWAPPTWGGFVPLTGQVGAADNQLAKLSVQVVVNPFLKYATRWYMADCSHSEKPLIWVVREAPKTVPRTAENDPLMWDSHKHAWGGYDRVAGAFGYPFLIARSG